MSICKRCGKDVEGIHTCTPAEVYEKENAMTTPNDPKARVVEIFGELGVLLNRSGSTMLEDRQFLADRLDSAGLLASAPVVPSEARIELILDNIWERYGKEEWLFLRERMAVSLRAHLLTLGYKDNSDLLAAQAEVTRLREALGEIAKLDYSHAAVNGCAHKAVMIAREALAPKEPS